MSYVLKVLTSLTDARYSHRIPKVAKDPTRLLQERVDKSTLGDSICPTL